MNSFFRRLLCLLPLVHGVAPPAFGHDVIINEIMYHPSSENSAEEYIELWNTGTNAVSLEGWRFTRGIQFTITDTVLAPGAFLVVAADPASFSLKYQGVTNVVGGWQGTLGNGGENIELEDAQGRRADLVRYADEGDWAYRIRWPQDLRGWRWFAAHDGLGSSLELVNALLPNQHGQNWAASLIPQGTPGGANSAVTNNTPPLILNTRHSPTIPSSSDPVTITAEIRDDANTNLTVTLHYRLANTDPPPAFSLSPMADDGAHNDGNPGDAVYGAILPPGTHRDVVEFYVEARDNDGNTRSYPAAARQADGATFDHTANALYQVDDSVHTGQQPIYRLILTETERAILASGNIRQSNAEMNATMVTVDGTTTQLRYNLGVRIRGAGSRQAQIPNYRANIPSDTPWNGVTEINLNAQYGHSQLAGSAIAQKAGMPAANVRAIQVRVNSENLANAGLPQYGSYVLVEVVNGDWAANHFPNDPNGNVYSARRPNTDLSYLGTNPNTYINAGYAKSSNRSENDWSDLINLTFVLNNASDETYADEFKQVADPLEWAGYFAIFALTGSDETSLGTGVGDDYNMYRGVIDPRFQLLPHDFDTILGQGEVRTGNLTTAPIFRAAALPVVNRFLRHPQFAPLYYGELQRMLDTTFTPQQLHPLLDRLLQEYVPEQVIAEMKQFSAERSAFVRSQIPLRLTATAGLPLVNGFPESSIPTLGLSGQANAIETRAVRVNGLPAAWVAWQANWNISSIPLNPGMNHLVVQAFNENGDETDRQTIDVRYVDGSEVALTGSLASDTTWTAAAGPYRITGNLIVPAGVTLTIEPGTTVYFNPNAALTVNGAIHAVGTELQRIWLAAAPAANGTDSWTAVAIRDSNESNRLSFVEIQGAGSVNHSLELTRSTLLADHITFSGTTETLIELNNASIHITDSVFPTITGAEHIHGGPMPPGGFVIIERNVFGSTTGLNDIIDFTDARRPGPVLQILDNVFTGASDDVLDLDGADSHIEGNVFMHVHKDNNNAGDTSCAISYGQDGGYAPHVVVVRNLFYDVDHVALVKEGGTLDLINNTAVGINIAAVNFSEPERGVEPGAGARLDGNIFWNPPGWTGTNFQNLHPTNGTVELTVTRSILSPVDLPDNDDNIALDPRLMNVDSNTITALTIRHDFQLKSGSPARGAGPNGIDMGALVPAGASISGAPTDPTHLADATLTIDGPGITDYRFRIDQAPFSDETPITTPIVLDSLGEGGHVVDVIGKNSAGVWQDVAEAASINWTVDPAFSRLVINEILASNGRSVPINGEFPDLIELRNLGGTPVDLSGMGLSDNRTNKYKFVFPAGTTLAAGDYLTLIGGDNPALPGLKTGFQLKQEGDDLYLHDALGRFGALIDSVTFGIQVPGLSVGRLDDGSWALTRPTLGATNRAQPTADPDLLKINEWLADGAVLFQDDFVELYNPDPLPVRLGGLYLTDKPLSSPPLHRIADLSFMPGNGYQALVADGNPQDGADHLSFRLSAQQGIISLYNTDLSLIDCVYYGPQSTDVSQGRQPNGSDTLAFFGPNTQSQATPGGPNPSGGSTTVTNISTTLFELAADWRYENSGSDLGTEWREPGFDDSGWATGGALLGFEIDPLPAPGLTTTFAPYSRAVPTYYFRTRFVLETNIIADHLTVTSIIDDGGIIYLNGVELVRIRMQGGTIGFSSLATSSPPTGDAAVEIWEAPISALLEGTNVLAVEVHQSSFNSSDVVWGMELTATTSITNPVGQSLILSEVLANSSTDWVELHNPTETSINAAGMSLTDDLNDPRRWVFPEGAVIAPGGYLVVRFDGDSPQTTTNSPALNTGFGLSASGETVFLFDGPSQGSTLLSSVHFGIQAPEFSISRVPVSTGPWQLSLPTPNAINIPSSLAAPSALRINEWMADPASGDDWFEIYNPSAQPVAIGGLHLTDNLNDRTKHRIAPLSFIGSRTNGFQRFEADNNPENGADHVTFRLGAGGESIGISTANGVLIDGISFGRQVEGVSQGRLPDGGGTIVSFPETQSPGESNFLPLEQVVINEALTHSDPPLEDAIELRNLTDESIPIGGWYLSDSKDELRKYLIPPHAVLAPRGFMVFYENQFNPEPGRFLSFALSSANGDQVYLSAANAGGVLTGFRASARFGPAENGVPFGRHETSVGADFTAMSERSLGRDNPGSPEDFRSGRGLPNPAPQVGPIVINEIMYHPPDLDGTNDNVMAEFIELHNITSQPVTLADGTNGWRLRDAVDFDFAPSTTIPAGGFLLVTSFDPDTNLLARAEFQAAYALAPATPMVGPYRGKLNNNSDSVELRKPDDIQPNGSVPYVDVDRVEYADSSPWPIAADDGTNSVSLQRFISPRYGNDPVNWFAAGPTPGSRSDGSHDLPDFTMQPASQSVVPGSPATFQVAVASTSPLLYQWRRNSRDLPGQTNSSLAISDVQMANTGDYSVRVNNSFGAALSSTATLSLQLAPEIIQHPLNAIVAPGTTATFSVATRGSLPLSYQWSFNGNALPGETRPDLLISDVQVADEGAYSVEVSNALGSAASSSATLTINQPPVIIEQPLSTTVLAGREAVFSPLAIGSAPLGYQWRFNGLDIPGANNRVLTIPNVQPGNAGSYSFRVTNLVGSAVSAVATLTVVIPPQVSVIATDPLAEEATLDTATFTLTRTGNPALPLTVSFDLGGTAAAGTDYEPINTTAQFPAEETSLTVTLTPIDDDTIESAETVTLTILEGADYIAGTPASATAWIADDDNQRPSIAIITPAGDSLFPITPANILFEVAATDAEGPIARVAYYNWESNLLGVADSAPFSFTWINAAPGTNQVTAIATDNLGATNTSAPVRFFVNIPPTVTITTPVAGARFNPPADVLIEAEATDLDGVITRVDFYASGVLVDTDTTPPYSATHTNADVGIYLLTAIATDDRGMSVAAEEVAVRVKVPSSQFADLFSDRGEVTGHFNFITGDNSGATFEFDEPPPFGFGTRTMWLSWEAPASGLCVLETVNNGFDTILTVFISQAAGLPTLESLTMIDRNDNASGSRSQVVFNAAAGTTYHIRIEGYGPFDFGEFEFQQILLSRQPAILFQPENQIVGLGGDATLLVVLTGNEPLTAQWQRNGVNISGGTISNANGGGDGTTVAIAQLELPDLEADDFGAYRVIVSNPLGSATSAEAIIQEGFPPSFIELPQSQTVVQGDTVSFHVVMDGTPPFGYRWRKGGLTVVPIEIGTDTYTITNVQLSHAGSYNVIVTNPINTAPGVLSRPFAVLTVLADTDGDHNPDVWEIDNGFDPYDPSDGPIDTDGDGVTNAQEYRDGTNPRDPPSNLELAITLESGTPTVRFTAAANASYSLLYKDSLTAPVWIKLTDLPAEPAPREAAIPDPGGASETRFYQVVSPSQEGEPKS